MGPVEVEWEPVIEQVLYNVSGAGPAPRFPDVSPRGGFEQPPRPMPPPPMSPPPPRSPAPATPEEEYEAGAAAPAEEWGVWEPAESWDTEPPTPAAPSPPPSSIPAAVGFSDLLPLADSQPAAVVIMAFTRLETAVLDLLRRSGVLTTVPGRINNSLNLEALLREGVSRYAISKELAESVRGLRELRDVATEESTSDLVTPARATRYIAAAEAVLGVVNEFASLR